MMRRTRRPFVVAALVVLYAGALLLAEVDLGALARGLPRFFGFFTQAWPPSFDELDVLLVRAGETAAIALVGTTIAVVLALGTCTLAARNVTPNALIRQPARGLLNILRGVDSFVFALLFVAAVGLGPFAGVLGVALHSWGSAAKLYADNIEEMPTGPLETARLTGAGWSKVVGHAVLPDATPGLFAVSLYVLEYNIRSSTVLGIVGAGGIGLELKNSVDLLNFPRMLTVLLVILIMVTAVDQLSSQLRRRIS